MRKEQGFQRSPRSPPSGDDTPRAAAMTTMALMGGIAMIDAIRLSLVLFWFLAGCRPVSYLRKVRLSFLCVVFYYFCGEAPFNALPLHLNCEVCPQVHINLEGMACKFMSRGFMPCARCNGKRSARGRKIGAKIGGYFY